jgi:hypothetical protein
MHKSERIHLHTETKKSAITKLDGSTPFSMTRTALENRTVAFPKLAETAFLLDWLSGGEVVQRNIQGFPLRFEAAT